MAAAVRLVLAEGAMTAGGQRRYSGGRIQGRPTLTAAIWAAIAATFSAISSLLIVLIQRRNLLESVKPELVLTGWERTPRGQGGSAQEVISFKTIRNVGRGPALHVILMASEIKLHFQQQSITHAAKASRRSAVAWISSLDGPPRRVA